MPSPYWVAPFPGQVVLGCMRKLAKHELGSEPARLNKQDFSMFVSAPTPFYDEL